MKTIPLTKGKETVVDDDTYEWASKYRWCYNGEGYVVRQERLSDANYSRKTIYLHVEIMNRKGYYTKQGEVFDHKDRDLKNNLFDNIRRCTKQQNCCNSPSRGGTSKYKGVTFHQGKWQARIRVFDICISLGHFTIEEEAARTYDAAAKYYFKEFAYTNFQDLEDVYKPPRRYTDILNFIKIKEEKEKNNKELFLSSIAKLLELQQKAKESNCA